MGRTKNVPMKKDLSLGSCSLSTIGEFIPIFRKKAGRGKPRKHKDISYNLLMYIQEQHKEYYLGEMLVGSTSNEITENIQSCKIAFKSDEEQSSIILNSNNICIVVKVFDDLPFLKDFVHNKLFSFEIYKQDENVYFKVYLTSIPLPKFSTKIGKSIQTAFEMFYGVNMKDSIQGSFIDRSSLSNSELDNVYKNLLDKQNKSQYLPRIKNINLELLRPKLRPYQVQSLQWMIYRETEANGFNVNIHPLYQEITLKSGTHIYLDKYSGWIEKDPPTVKTHWKGGILADEMGLGKTVEVLALILANRYQDLNETSNSKKNCSDDDDDVDSGDVPLSMRIQEKKTPLSSDCKVENFVETQNDDDDADDVPLNMRIQVKKRPLPSEKKIDVDSDDERLIIDKQAKKRRMPAADIDKHVKEKKSKIPEAFVKKSTKNKSATFEALETIYKRTLLEYSATEARVRLPESQVQCICGSDKEKGCVKCTDCEKMQHKLCLGWRKELGPYKCPQCWEKAELLKSRATLIVAPIALRKQWCREMTNHLKAGLKVLNYEGYSATPVYPTKLQDYDIVITTYNVLQAELKITDTEQSLSLRRQRKYWPGSSPLIRIQWWRLCLDEAQTVEVTGSLVSSMARKIPACHRWAVTGTPMAKRVSDIFGLIDYLQMEPYNDPDTWKHILYDPYVMGNTEPMYNFLSQVLWRTSKDSVLDQINIPAQTHELHLLEFSAVEKFYYSREHEVCAREFLKIASKFDPELPLQKMDKSDLKNLMGPLLSLRQACSDPSAVKGKGRYLSLKKNASSMKDLLEALILKNRNDCEDNLRLMVCAINGLAGIYLLMQDADQAIHEYRKVLQLSAKFIVEEKKGKLDVDKLPLIHAMHNLADILQSHAPNEHTLRDSTLSQDCAELEKKYIEKFMKETASAKVSCRAISDTVKQHEAGFILKHGQWYSDGFDYVAANDLDEDLVARVDVAAANANVDCDLRAENSRSLLRRAYNWHQSLTKSRKTLCATLDEMYHEDSKSKRITMVDGLVEQARDCHLRPQLTKLKKKTTKCLVCVANEHLKNYEGKLFTMKRRADMFEEMGLVGSWKPTLDETLLKSLLGLLKAKHLPLFKNLIKDGETHVLLIEALKKEFKEIRKFWTYIDQQVCAQDELDICKVRLQLKTADENEHKPNRMLKNLSYNQAMIHENINLLRIDELPHQELILRSEETRHNARLEALLGTRNYLETLRQQQFENYKPDPCPVCRGPLVNTWAILPCAHTYCLNCFKNLTLNKFTTTHILCCVCRSKQNLQDIAYIKSGQTSQDITTEDDDTQVLGNYSRKVEDVVRLLLKLRKHDPQVKVLLFSTWFLVLQLLKKALKQNDIKVELADGYKSFENRIESFKDPVKKITVLLLPIQKGAKGLNLIEATHVVLLEPLLNPADELQAIGRVHRIGQTKPTVVHKFLVKNTVEESLHNATNSNAAGWEKGKLTVGQLKTLFLDSCIEDPSDNLMKENAVLGQATADIISDDDVKETLREEIDGNGHRNDVTKTGVVLESTDDDSEEEGSGNKQETAVISLVSDDDVGETFREDIDDNGYSTDVTKPEIVLEPTDDESEEEESDNKPETAVISLMSDDDAEETFREEIVDEYPINVTKPEVVLEPTDDVNEEEDSDNKRISAQGHTRSLSVGNVMETSSNAHNGLQLLQDGAERINESNYVEMIEIRDIKELKEEIIDITESQIQKSENILD